MAGAEISKGGTLTLVVVIPWILILLTAGVGIWRFTAEQRQANRLPFLQKRLELCFQATEVAGRLASGTGPVEWEKDRVTFWRLYWGLLSIVENLTVENAMVELGKLVPQKPDPAISLPMTSLGTASYRLAHAARDLVLSSWQVDLPDMQASGRNEPCLSVFATALSETGRAPESVCVPPAAGDGSPGSGRGPKVLAPAQS